MGGVLDPEGAHLASLRRLVDFKGLNVLEVGCGDGRLTVPVAREAATVFAFDPDVEAIRRARESLPATLANRVSYRVASATEVEVPSSAYDLVLFSWSL
jgi:2-polyprenyl-3-methyl-5-hydroxy-6-metoxy-1,4-benzoquinol methylase